MGKGDQRSRRGKIFAGTFGKSRPKKKNQKTVPGMRDFFADRGRKKEETKSEDKE